MAYTLKVKRFLYFINAFILLVFVLDVQAQTFSKRYDWFGQLEGETGFSCEPSENGYIITRVGDQIGTSLWRVGFLEINEEGDLLWENEFADSTASLTLGRAGSADFKSGVGYVECGTYNYLGPGMDAWLIRFNEQGDTLWTRRYGATDKQYLARQVVITNDGGYAMVGYTDDFSTANTNLFCSFLLKYDSNGDFQWIKKYEGDLAKMKGNSIDQSPEGLFVLSSSIDPLGNGSVDSNHLLILTDENGNEQWRHEYGDLEADGSSWVKFLENGDILLTGEISRVTSMVAGYLYYNRINTSEGTSIWDYSFTSVSGTVRNLFSSLELEDGGLVSTGVIERPDPTWSFPVHYAAITKLTAEGDSLWLHRYAWDEGAGVGGWIRDLKRASDGGFVCSGSVYWSEDHPSSDVWVLKLDEYGCLIPGCQVGVIEHESQLGFNTYPNPASDVLSVYVETNLNMKGHFSLTDLNGRIVFQGSAVLLSPEMPTTYMYQVAHLARGMYVLSFESEEGAVLSKKVLLQ